MTAADRQEIWDHTQCSASVRARAHMPRSPNISGPFDKLVEAQRLAMMMVENNKKMKANGKTLPAGGGEFKGSEDRKQAGAARRAAWETPPKRAVPQDAHEASGSDGRAQPASTSFGHGWFWNGWAWQPAVVSQAAA